VAIGEWAAAQGRAVLDCLGDGSSARVPPCEATLRRCRQATDASALDAAVGGWAGGQLAARQARAVHTRGEVLVSVDAGLRVLTVDGKTLRGSAPRSTPEQVAAARSGAGRTPPGRLRPRQRRHVGTGRLLE
jgi:hypothetical protein